MCAKLPRVVVRCAAKCPTQADGGKDGGKDESDSVVLEVALSRENSSQRGEAGAAPNAYAPKFPKVGARLRLM